MALTAARRRIEGATGTGEQFEVPMAASTTIYDGDVVCFDASGNAVPGADTANYTIAGIAKETVVNSGSAGDKTIVVEAGQQEWLPVASGLTAAAKGKDACLAGDASLTNAATATNDIRIGKILEFKTGYAKVWVARHALSAA